MMKVHKKLRISLRKIQEELWTLRDLVDLDVNHIAWAHIESDIVGLEKYIREARTLVHQIREEIAEDEREKLAAPVADPVVWDEGRFVKVRMWEVSTINRDVPADNPNRGRIVYHQFIRHNDAKTCADGLVLHEPSRGAVVEPVTVFFSKDKIAGVERQS